MGTKHNLRILAAVSAAGLALTACGSTDDARAPRLASSDCTSGQQIAFLGATTGDAGALGQNMVGGIKLALDDYNKAHADCKIGVKIFDSQGDPEKATPLATQIVNDKSIIGLVGPGFSGESLATGKTFIEAGLPSISPSATNVTITQQGWTTWHRVIGNDVGAGCRRRDVPDQTPSAPPRSSSSTTAPTTARAWPATSRTASADAWSSTDTVQTGQTDFSADRHHGHRLRCRRRLLRRLLPRGRPAGEAAAPGGLQGHVHVG